MGRARRRSSTAASQAAAARRWAERLERPSWRWLTTRWAILGLVGLVVGVVGLYAVSQLWLHTQMGEPLLECHSTERDVEYDVRWQWLPPGLVCDYVDGQSRYVGL